MRGECLSQCVTNEDNCHIIEQRAADVRCMKRLASSLESICTQGVQKCFIQKVQIRSNPAGLSVSYVAVALFGYSFFEFVFFG